MSDIIIGTMAEWQFTGNVSPSASTIAGLTPGSAAWGADVLLSPLTWSQDLWVEMRQPGVAAITGASGSTTSTTYASRAVYVDLPVAVSGGVLQIDSVEIRACRNNFDFPVGAAVRTSIDSYATEVAKAEVTGGPQNFQFYNIGQVGFAAVNTATTITVRVYVWTPSPTSALVVDSIALIGSFDPAAPLPAVPAAGVDVRIGNGQEMPVDVYARVGGAETPVDVFARVGGVERLVKAWPRTDPGFALTAVAGTNEVTVSWPNVPTAAGGYRTGRDGTDLNGNGAWSTIDPQGTTSRVFNLLQTNVTYKFTVAALDSNGATIVEASIFATPGGVTPPPPPPPPPPPGPLPPGSDLLLQGDSGLPWNHMLQGRMGNLTNKRAAWSAWLGHPTDGIEYFHTRSTWDSMKWIDPAIVPMRGFKVLTIPSQPQGPNNDQNNTLGASGQYNWWWRDFGTQLVNLGMNNNRTIIRLNHEPQPASYAWHSWHWGAPNVETFVQSWRNAAYNIRETAPDVLICVNHSRNHFDTRLTGGRTWGQCTDLLMDLKDRRGRFLVDLVTQDHYDVEPGVTPNGVNPGPTQRLANWYQQIHGVNSATPPGRSQGFGIPSLGTCYAYCVDATARRGSPVYFWAHEWGLGHRDDAQGGDDDPYFIQLIWDWFNERALGNGGLMLGESYFNDEGAPSTFRHTVFDYNTGTIPSYNKNAGALFKQLWGA